MTNPRPIDAILYLATFAALAGCTTLEVDDVYAPAAGMDIPATGEISRNFGVSIDPDTRFYAVGILGAPVIPTVAKRGTPDRMSVSAWIDSSEPGAFSFAGAPCLQDDDGSKLCPRAVEVDNFVHQKPPPNESDADRWLRERAPKKRIASLVIPLDGTGRAEARIGRARIYRHFELAEDAQWERFRVDVTYRYRCHGECPARLTLDRTDVIEIDGRSAIEGPMTYVRTRKLDYHPAVEVQ